MSDAEAARRQELGTVHIGDGRASPETSPPAPCRACGGDIAESVDAYGTKYDRCGTCAALQKRLTPGEYEALDVDYDPGVYLDQCSREDVSTFLEVPAKEKVLRKAGVSGGRFLDIGCGMGGYLLAAQRLGCEVLGFEPSENHARVAVELLGFPVIQDYFHSSKVEGPFDAIMLSHVIEHIYDQKAFLEDILSVLAPGGVLIVMTPNADSLTARFLDGRWPMLIPADHVTMLTPKSFKALLGSDIAVSTSEYPYEFAATWLSQVRRRLAGLGKKQDAGHTGQPQIIHRQSSAARIMRAGLAAASLPLYLVARLTNRASCLIVTVRAASGARAAQGRS